MKPLTAIIALILIGVVVGGIVLRFVGGGESGAEGTIPNVDSPPTPHPEAITISIASSITKWEWLDAAVEDFNTASQSVPNLQIDGRPVQVEVLLEKDPLTGKLRHWNSPTQVAATLRGEIEPTILSPAAKTWIFKLNRD